MDTFIPVSKTTSSLAIISPFLYNISISEPELLKNILLLFHKKALIKVTFLMIIILKIIVIKNSKKLVKNRKNKVSAENSIELSNTTTSC